MILFMRREVRNLMRVAPNDAIHDRLRDVQSTLDQVSVEDEFQTKTDIFVEVVCEAIKLKDVAMSILALQSLKTIVESKYINVKSLQLITETVTRIEFTSLESELVEEGYHQAVRVCRAMVKCSTSHQLTNGSISEIIIYNFRVVNSKLVKWLRSKAVRTLLSITRILFRRLGEFPEDPNLKPSYQIRLRLGGAASQSTFKELAEQSIANDQNSSSTSSTLRIITERNQPFNLAFINDYFCYLSSLINLHHEPEPVKGAEDKILLGLRLLKVAFSEAAQDIGQRKCLIHVTRNNITYNIVSILKTTRSVPMVSNALSLAVDIFVQMRHHLKYQLEAFLERLMEMLATQSEQSGDSVHQTSTATSIELRSDILNAVLELFRHVNHFSYELYYNFDCDPYSSNIYENLIQICSKNCFQHPLEAHFTPIQLTSFKCLLSNLADVYIVETGPDEMSEPHQDQETADSKTFQTAAYTTNSAIGNCDNNNIDNANPDSSTTKTSQRAPRTCIELHNAKKRKRLLWLALEKFNARPKDGVQFMKDNKLIENDWDLVKLLRDNLRVDKKVLGEYLSKPENTSIREAFITSLDFTNLRVDEALRLMLEKFRLPGESQLIDRLVDVFSRHWFEQNPGILQNSDRAHCLAYAVIMLNVDQHSKKVKPMTCDQFDRNLLGPDRERIYDSKLLDQIYTNIRDNEIVLPDEQVGAIRQRYLWKCTTLKSERPEALYWAANSELKAMNKILFEIMWSPTIAALSFIFDKIDTSLYPDLARQIVDQGFIKFAHLCAQHGHLDNLIVSLCKFTTDLSPIPHHSHAHSTALSSQRHVMSDKNSLAALSLLSIIRDYASCMRGESWSNIVRNIIQWYCSKCIDDVVQVDDFALQRKLSLRMREIKKSPSTMNAQSSTFLRSVYTYFAGSTGSENGSGGGGNSSSGTTSPNDTTRDNGGSNDTVAGSQNGTPLGGAGSAAQSELMATGSGGSNNGSNLFATRKSSTANPSKAPSAIQVLIQTIQDAEYCQESLVEFIAALSTATIDGDPEEVEDAEVFKLEIFTQVILNNKPQALAIWPRIRAYFARQSSICGRSMWLGERIISAAFRVAIQFKPKPEVFSLLSHIIATLDAEIVRGEHTFVALMTLTELHSLNVISMDAKELEACFNQVIFPFFDKVLDGCDPIQQDKTLNRAINLLSKIFLKHHKILKELQTFALLWYAILDAMEKYIKANSALKEATFELVKNMVLVMDNEQCMSIEMKDITRTKFMFWEFQSGSDY